MALTQSDLNKIEALFDFKFKIAFAENLAPIRADIAELKDMMVEMHTFIMTEFPVQNHRLADHETRIVKLERAA